MDNKENIFNFTKNLNDETKFSSNQEEDLPDDNPNISSYKNIKGKETKNESVSSEYLNFDLKREKKLFDVKNLHDIDLTKKNVTNSFDFAKLIFKYFSIYTLLFLTLLTLIAPISTEIEGKWISTSLFHFTRENTGNVFLQLNGKCIFESFSISAIGLFGYISQNKFSWLYLCPWLIRSLSSWIETSLEYIKITLAVLDTTNMLQHFIVFGFLLLTQTMIISEILYYVYFNWRRMNIMDEERTRCITIRKFCIENSLDTMLHSKNPENKDAIKRGQTFLVH